MANIEHVFCWLGGVIASSVPDNIIFWLQSQTEAKVGFWLRSTIHELGEDLSLGRLDSLTFCLRVIDATKVKLDARELEAAILSSTTIRTSVLDVLGELSPIRKIWLISDYPRNWFIQIAAPLNSCPFIHPDRLLFPAEYQLPRLAPDLFYLMVRKTHSGMDACMMVDGMSARAVEAVRHGLSSEIFIDTPRLRREFVLRKMLAESDS